MIHLRDAMALEHRMLDQQRQRARELGLDHEILRATDLCIDGERISQHTV